jgi:Tol biopolymer transport system component
VQPSIAPSLATPDTAVHGSAGAPGNLSGQVAFVSQDRFPNGRLRSDIHVLDLATGAVVNRTRDELGYSWTLNPIWTPDGDLIVQSIITSGGYRWDLVHVGDDDAPNELSRDLALDEVSAPSLSPDGTTVVYALTGAGRDGLFTYTLASQEEASLLAAYQLRAELGVNSLHMAYPAWSPDGGRVAFSVLADDTTDLRILDIATGDVSVVADAGENEFQPAWSPDGTQITFEVGTGGSMKPKDSDVYVVDVAGKLVTRLTDAPGRDGSPSWSPDGDFLVFESDRDGTLAIWVMDVDGANQRRLVATQGVLTDPTWWQTSS